MFLRFLMETIRCSVESGKHLKTGIDYIVSLDKVFSFVQISCKMLQSEVFLLKTEAKMEKTLKKAKSLRRGKDLASYALHSEFGASPVADATTSWRRRAGLPGGQTTFEFRRYYCINTV